MVAAHEALARGAVEVARDEREGFGDDVVVCSVGILGSYAGSAVALVEITRAGNVLVVLHESAVVFATGAAGSRAFLELVTRTQFFDSAFGDRSDVIAKLSVDRKAIGCVSDERHLLFTTELLDEPGRQAVVVVGPARLDVGLTGIETEVDLAGEGFVSPAAVSVAVPPLASD